MSANFEKNTKDLHTYLEVLVLLGAIALFMMWLFEKPDNQKTPQDSTGIHAMVDPVTLKREDLSVDATSVAD